MHSGNLSIGDEPKFDPVAKSVPDLLTMKQNGLIFAGAKNAGVDAHDECDRIFDCEIHELSKLGASRLIDHLQKLPQVARTQKPKPPVPDTKRQFDLFSQFENSAPTALTASPAASDFEPVWKRAAFADPANPLVVRAREIMASCGVRQISPDTYIVSSLTEAGADEFSVTVSKTGGPKCACPDFVKKSPLVTSGRFRCEHIIAAHMFYREICEALRD